MTPDPINRFDPLNGRKHNLDEAPRSLAFRGGGVEEWRREALDRLGLLLGLPLRKPDDDGFSAEWTAEFPGYTETRFVFKTEADVWAPAHLLMPKNAGRSPAPPLMICLQGHGTGMHVSLGRNLAGEPDEAARTGDHAYALQCVSLGCAALTLELRGFGESGGLQENHRPNCQLYAGSALLVGRTLAGERVWDIMRAIDAVLAHFEGFDPGRIGIMGVSGGGAAALYASVMEPRIAAALLGCCFSSYRDSIGLISHCPCNHIPGMLRYFEMGDVAGLIAPRPLVIVNGDEDRIFPFEPAKAQFETTRRVYAALGAAGKCEFIGARGGHGFYPSVSWKGFGKISGWF